MKLYVIFLLTIFKVYSELDYFDSTNDNLGSPNLRIPSISFRKCTNCYSFENSTFSFSKKEKIELMQFCITFCTVQHPKEITKDSVNISNLAIILVSSIVGGALIIFSIITLVCCCVPDCPWYNCCNNCNGPATTAPVTPKIIGNQSQLENNPLNFKTANGEMIISGEPGYRSTPIQIKSGQERGSLQNQISSNPQTERNLKEVPTPIQIHAISGKSDNFPPLRTNLTSVDQRGDIPSPIQIIAAPKNSEFKNSNINYNGLTGRSILEKPLQLKGNSGYILSEGSINPSSK